MISVKRGMRGGAMVALLVWGMVRLVAAPAVPVTAYGGMRWRLVGPFRGGRVLAVTGVPTEPDTWYLGSVVGGVWKTTNGGATWKPLFDREPVASIGAIAVAPSNPNVVYVGTGESAPREDISFGDGVYKSTDAGRTWTNVGLHDSRHIGRIIVDPHNPDVVLVAAMGHFYGPNTERGVFRSADGGHTWQRVLYKDEHTRRHRPRVRSEQSLHRVRGDVAGGSHAVEPVERRSGQRTVSVHRRRADLDPPGGSRPADRRAGEDRRVGRRPQRRRAGLRPHRGRGRGAVSVGQRRADVEAGERQPGDPDARLVLHAHLREPGGSERRCTWPTTRS